MSEWNWCIGGCDVYVQHTDAGYVWDAVAVEHIIVGGYPGSPDTNETAIADGVAPTLADAKWAAIRHIDRALVREDIYEWELTEHYGNDPEYPDPRWWVGSTEGALT